MVTESFATWFRERLKRRGWSQADFSRASGIPHPTVSTWYRGARLPDPENCDLIADALHVDVADVLRAAGHLPDVPEDSEVVREFHAMLRRITWTPNRVKLMRDILRNMSELD